MHHSIYDNLDEEEVEDDHDHELAELLDTALPDEEEPMTLDDLFDVDFLLDMEEGIFEQLDYISTTNDAHDDDIIISYITDYVSYTIHLIAEDLEPCEDEIMQFIKERVATYRTYMQPSPPCPPTPPSPPSPPRSIPISEFHILENEETHAVLKSKIEFLKNQIQPEQRTQEWYDFRNTLITASNIYKIFGSKSQYNSLICEKCLPPTKMYEGGGGGGGPRQWGQKYEKLSLQIYKEMFQTEVEEFGCIRHPQYSFIGASPDGIVVGPNHYGRMIEIKNIVNRKITGEPMESHWVQMQIQMEVCDLDLCNFIETRFKECDSAEEWKRVDKKKGIVFQEMDQSYTFISNETETDNDDFLNKWRLMNNFQMWYMDEFSCLVVPRDRQWFESVLSKIQDAWDVILKEKENGEYVQRMPKKRVSKCLISFTETDMGTGMENNHNHNQYFTPEPPQEYYKVVKLEGDPDIL
jgi:putative phage-type endonuclease